DPLDLRTDQDFLFSFAIKERLNSAAVSRSQKPAIAGIPYNKGEFSIEPMDKIHTMLLVEMNDDFGVRMGAETMALIDQFFSQLFVVVNFTIESDADGAVLVVERLVSLLEVDDAQANMAEGECATVEQCIARAIRTAVARRRTQPSDVFDLRRACNI